MADPGFKSRRGKTNLSLLQNIKTNSGAHPASYLMGSGLLSPGGGGGGGVKRPGCEANHPRKSSAEFKNEWIYISTPLYAFMACIASTLPLPK
jgi:hypothetical protein